MSVKLPSPQSGNRMLTLFVMRLDETIYTGWLRKQLVSDSLPGDIALDYVRALETEFPKGSHGKHPGDWYVDSRDVLSKADRFKC